MQNTESAHPGSARADLVLVPRVAIEKAIETLEADGDEHGVALNLFAMLATSAEQHSDDAAVDAFAVAMKEKLAAARAKGRGGWEDKEECSQLVLSHMLRGHVEKGDPRDVANFCCFLWSRGEGILAGPKVNEPFGNPELLPLNEPSGDSGQLASLEQRAERLLQQARDGWFDASDTIPRAAALRAITAALSAEPRGVEVVPSERAFASAVWRDWMTNEQADRLGAEIRSWVLTHLSAAPQPREMGCAHDWRGDGLCDRCGATYTQPGEVRGVDLSMEPSFKPHPRWKEGDGSSRHPQTLSDWDWREDRAPHALERSRHRLNVAADYADDRAPDQMACVLRIDLIRVLQALTHQTARAESLSARATNPQDAAGVEPAAWMATSKPSSDGTVAIQFTHNIDYANQCRRADWTVTPLYTTPPPGVEGGKPEEFQAGVERWMAGCFVPSLYSNMTERGDRLVEEVLELLQAHGYDPSRIPTLVDYVYGRPPGEPGQEVGGVMVTLAGYCWIAGLNMHAEADWELARITRPEVMAKIRAKQEAKNALHFDTPLPGDAAALGVQP